MRELLEIFHHPEKGVFTVVVGGTKGKGSTAYFLSEILRESGLRTGFYHSPHLESPRERIWINGKPVSENDFSNGLAVIARMLRPRHPAPFTYFEILTLLAALLFKKAKVDVAVYEVGMGGRLDATHVLPAKLIILTPIHFDHEAYLGNTLTEITKEKAALLVPGCDAVIAPQEPESLREILKVAKKRKSRLWPPLYRKGMKIKLLGDFQKLNAATALRAAVLLRDHHRLPITKKSLTKGVANNHWPGRMEFFKGSPSILIDGAHNPKSIEALCRNLRRIFPKRRKIVVFGTSRDKRSDRMIPLLAEVFGVCILTQSQTPRAKDINLLLAEAKDLFQTLIPLPDAREALAMAKKLAAPSDLIVVTGSFYLIGELRRLCRK